MKHRYRYPLDSENKTFFVFVQVHSACSMAMLVARGLEEQSREAHLWLPWPLCGGGMLLEPVAYFRDWLSVEAEAPRFPDACVPPNFLP
jgi:hypothetical protein